MKIGFDISQTGNNKTGTGVFAYSLIDELSRLDHENEYILYPTFGEYFGVENWTETIYRPVKENFKTGLGHRTMPEMRNFWRFPPADFEDQLGNPDIIHANNFYVPQKSPNFRLVFSLYDIGFLEEPEWTTETNRVVCFDGVFRASLFADALLAISDSTRRIFLEYFPHYPPERVITIPLGSRFPSGAEIAAISPHHKVLPGKFWLTASTLEPRKNFSRLIEAYGQLKKAYGQTYPLVMTGAQGWLMENFGREVEKLGLQDDIIQLGYVNETTLRWLYQNCFAFAFPTLYEGFGMTVLEAMSQGAAVVTSNTTSLPEVAGDAGILVDPYDVGAIFNGLQMLVDGRANREEMRAKSRQRAALFSWEKTARGTLEIYRQVMDWPKFCPR
jgi:glycosyltransferase involved in cell wall biosynthesis